MFYHIISKVVTLISQLPQNNEHFCAQYADRGVSPIWQSPNETPDKSYVSSTRRGAQIQPFLCNNHSKSSLTTLIFTESAQWTDSVIESPCLSVCLYIQDVAKSPLPAVVESSCERMYS